MQQSLLTEIEMSDQRDVFRYLKNRAVSHQCYDAAAHLRDWEKLAACNSHNFDWKEFNEKFILNLTDHQFNLMKLTLSRISESKIFNSNKFIHIMTSELADHFRNEKINDLLADVNSAQLSS